MEDKKRIEMELYKEAYITSLADPNRKFHPSTYAEEALKFFRANFN